MRFNVAWTLLGVCVGAHAEDLRPVLARMDTGAAGFRSISANIRRVSFTALINDRLEETGTCKFYKQRSDVRVLVELSKPDERAIAFAGRKVQIYTAKSNIVQEIDLGRQKGQIDRYLLLGFGTSGKELAREYTVKYGGEEAVSGQKATRIELVPRSDEVRRQFSKMELWIADPFGYPVQQKLHEPSGNYLTVTYTGVKLNSDLSPEQLSLRLPKDVKREYPQK
jgi:outer membrane lipoprotein-sorting protein